MKKIILTLALAILGQFAIAQNIQVQNAFSYQKSAQQLIDDAESLKASKPDKAAKRMNDAKIQISKAKEAIDAASQNEQTMNQAKTWHYYSVIYYKIGAYPEFIDLDHDAYAKVLTSIDRIKTLDPNYYAQMGPELSSYVRSIGNSYYQLGVDSFNSQNYEDAMNNFQKVNEAVAKVGAVDDAAMSSYALCASKVGRYEEAAATYETLIAKGFEDATYYQHLIGAYRELGQGDKAVETIATARAKYPEDPKIINEMISTYLTLKREAEIVPQIEEMAEKYTDQPVYYLILGTIYGNKESNLYDLEKALGYYDRAIMEDANYADAYNNAGALLIEKAADIYQAANDADQSQYKDFKAYLDATNAMSDEAKSYDERALPYVEKTHQLLPDDAYVRQALRSIYVRLKMMDKAKELEN